MTDKELHRYTKWGISAFVALFSIFILYLNVLVPYLPGDDHIFLLKLPETGILGHSPIQSLSDLIESQTNFYNNYHYRVLNHTLLQVLLLCPPIVFDISNTLVFLLLPYCLLRILPKTTSMVTITSRDINYWTKYVLLLAFIWLFHFDLGRCYFLTTGALNYSWLLIPQLLYITELIRYNDDEGNTTFLLILALANCMANENVIIALCLMTLYVAFVKRKASVIPIICLLIFAAGLFFMLSSPSIDNRLANDGFREAGWLSHLLEYSKRVVYYSFRYLPIILLYALLREAPPQVLSRDSFTPLLPSKEKWLLAIVIIATGAMAFVPLYEPRSAIFAFFVLLMLVVSRLGSRVWPLGWVSVGLFLAVLVGLLRLPDFQALHHRHQANQVALEVHSGTQDTLGLQYYCAKSKPSYLLCHELSKDYEYMDNKSLAAYYHIPAVVSAPLVELDKTRKTLGIKLKSDLIQEGYNERSINNEKFYSLIQKVGDGHEATMRLVFLSDVEKYFIIRGARKGWSKDVFLQLLPQKLRLYFLAYLEDTTTTTQANKGLEGYYNYQEVHAPETYNYLLISEYSMEDHSPVGEVIKISITTQTVD